MGRILANVTNSGTVSRYAELCVLVEGVIDNAIHSGGELLKRGLLLMKTVANGKYRAYAEALVKAGGAFSNASAAFTLDPTSALVGYFRVGDVIESTSGTALGTIATFSAVTGVGTLTGNAANNLAAGQSVRVAESQAALSGNVGRILEDEILMDASDEAFDGFSEGFFVQSRTTVTAAALAKLGGYLLTTDEIRLK